MVRRKSREREKREWEIIVAREMKSAWSQKRQEKCCRNDRKKSAKARLEKENKYIEVPKIAYQKFMKKNEKDIKNNTYNLSENL